MPHFTKVIHCRMHLNDEFQNLLRVTGLFEKFNSQLTNLECWIVKLREEEPQGPGISRNRFTNKCAKMFGCIESNMLKISQKMNSNNESHPHHIAGSQGFRKENTGMAITTNFDYDTFKSFKSWRTCYSPDVLLCPWSDLPDFEAHSDGRMQ